MGSRVDSKTIKKIIDRKHPLYRELLPHWEFLGESYKGGRAWFSKNIFRYMKEGDIEYGDRVKRAYRFNHTREVVDLVNKYLFRAPISRKTEDVPEQVKTFWESVNSQGMSIDEFMRIVSLKASIFGRPWIVIDNRITGAGEEGEAEGLDLYAYLVPPQQVPDYAFDEAGELLWVLIEEHYRDDKDPIESTGDVSIRYRLWTRESWHLYAFKKGRGAQGGVWVEESNGRHDLGLVPVIPANNSVVTDLWDCPALIADVAYLDRAVANYASNLDAIIQDQTFSQLAMPAQNVLPGDDAYNKLLEMGTKRVFLYDGEGGQGPAYLSPDPRQATLIISAIQQLINEIYHSVGLAGERTKQDNSKGIDNSSGVAKSKDFERVVALLSSKADALEVIENQIVKVVCAWAETDAPEQEVVTYPVESQFDVRTLYDEIDVAMKLRIMSVPAILIQEQMGRLVEKLFPDLGDDLLKKMRDELKTWTEGMQESAELASQGAETSKRVVEEAKRNRDQAAAKKTETQSRENGKSSGQEKGQEK